MIDDQARAATVASSVQVTPASPERYMRPPFTTAASLVPSAELVIDDQFLEPEAARSVQVTVGLAEAI